MIVPFLVDGSGKGGDRGSFIGSARVSLSFQKPVVFIMDWEPQSAKFRSIICLSLLLYQDLNLNWSFGNCVYFKYVAETSGLCLQISLLYTVQTILSLKTVYFEEQRKKLLQNQSHLDSVVYTSASWMVQNKLVFPCLAVRQLYHCRQITKSARSWFQVENIYRFVFCVNIKHMYINSY